MRIIRITFKRYVKSTELFYRWLFRGHLDNLKPQFWNWVVAGWRCPGSVQVEPGFKGSVDLVWFGFGRGEPVWDLG